MAKSGTKKKAKARDRRERRFLPTSTASPLVVFVLGGLGALGMGAGAYGQFLPWIREGAEAIKYAPWILAGGAVLTGVAIWLGTSGESAIRVGAPGIAIERGGMKRMPWYEVESIRHEGGAIHISGRDQTKAGLQIVVKLSVHPQAAAWIVKEARDRIPDRVDIEESVELPDPSSDAGQILVAEPVQVVGMHCAETNKVIAYEPDARVCPRCERVYHKTAVPDECTCGASLTHLRPKAKAAS